MAMYLGARAFGVAGMVLFPLLLLLAAQVLRTKKGRLDVSLPFSVQFYAAVLSSQLRKSVPRSGRHLLRSLRIGRVGRVGLAGRNPVAVLVVIALARRRLRLDVLVERAGAEHHQIAEHAAAVVRLNGLAAGITNVGSAACCAAYASYSAALSGRRIVVRS